MKRKTLLALLLATSMAASMTVATGSVAFAETEEATEETADDAEATDDAEAADDAEATDDTADADKEAADKVAALIDAIYVQERNDDTDAQCKEAKEAWDALTDAQKELVDRKSVV